VDVTPCINPSHKATIDVLKERFGVVVPIPKAPPIVQLLEGDAIIVTAVNSTNT